MCSEIGIIYSHSINIQAVSDGNSVLMNVVAKFPGSVHDSYIFRNSSVHRMMQNMDDNCWLISKKVLF